MEHTQVVRTEAKPLRVMQWNTLADGLAQFGDFHWSKAGLLDPVDASSILDWEKRGPKLLKEVLRSDADVVCMQEVNHFGDFFLPHLSQHGYDGIFQAKHISPTLQYGFPPDGCAIFYRTSRLLLRETNMFLYPVPVPEEQNQGAIICRFQDLRADGREFIVATTHLKAKTGKENDEKRLSQAQSLLQKLVEQTQTNDSSLTCVVCGDFNAVPTSEVYDSFQRHELGLKSVYSCRETKEKDFPTRIDHILHGAAEDDKTERCVKVDWTSSGGASSEPAWTTWKYRTSALKMETIDYIWVSTDKALCPSQVRQIPSQESLGSKGLPSESMPSDHIPLVSELVWR